MKTTKTTKTLEELLTLQNDMQYAAMASALNGASLPQNFTQEYAMLEKDIEQKRHEDKVLRTMNDMQYAAMAAAFHGVEVPEQLTQEYFALERSVAGQNDALSIQPATENDVPTLHKLTVSLAVYEKKSPEEILVTEAKLRKWGFGTNRLFQSLLARWENEPVGMAVFYVAYSGYMGAPILYLEDLFVLPDFRNRGIGKKMLKWLADYAIKSECCRMQWVVYDWNAPAIEFYKSIAGVLRPDLVQVRLEGEQLQKFASES